MGDENQPDNLSDGDAERLIRRISQDSANVFPVHHAKKQMLERGINLRQMLTCLQKGSVTEGPYVNKLGNWQVTMTRMAAGQDLRVVVAIEWPDQLIVITAI